MLVSLFVDASLCSETKVGGWGCWAKSERGSTASGGMFKSRMQSANTAELAAMLNGVIQCLRSDVAKYGDSILVQSDNQHVVRVLQNKAKWHNSTEKMVMTKLQETIQDHNLQVIGRHIKGHTAVPHKRVPGKERFWVNGYCDRKAKFFMRKARRQLQNQKSPDDR